MNSQPLVINENYKIIGFTDSVTQCECCGKSELKGTYCVELDGLEMYFGSVCATKNHGVEKSHLKLADKVAKGLKIYFIDVYNLIGSYWAPESVFSEKIIFASKNDALDFIYSNWSDIEGYNNNPLILENGKQVSVKNGVKLTFRAWHNLETKKGYILGFDTV